MAKKAKAAVDPSQVKTVVARNKKARHDYALEDATEAGLVLTGTEVKSLRAGRASLVDGWVTLERGEAWMEGVHIPLYSEGTWTNHTVRRRRKLLLHRAQLERLEQKTREKGFTIVPLELYFRGGKAKVEIAVGRGKREFDKRQSLRERDDAREAQRAVGAYRGR